MSPQQAFRVVCLLFPSADAREKNGEAIAEACLRWTPQIAISPQGDAIWLEIGKCRGLYREETLRARLQVMAKRFETSFRIAIANDVPSATALARLGSLVASIKDLPIVALEEYADPFGQGDDKSSGLERASVARLIETLSKLGVTTLGHFMELKPGLLPSRFGKLGLFLHQRVKEARHLPWPRFAPQEKVLERVFLADVTESFRELEPLLFALKPAVDRAMARLRGRGLRAHRVRLGLDLERFGHLKAATTGTSSAYRRDWEWALALPQGSALSLLPVLRERLARDLERKPLGAPVTELEFEVLESAPGHSAQRDFFRAKEEETEAWNGMIAQLIEKLGEGKVFQAVPIERYSPEKAWKKVLSVADSSDDEAIAAEGFAKEGAERPLRLLKKPELLPSLGSSGGFKIHAVPEIISGEWWLDEKERHYFRLKTGRGPDLWVFRYPDSDSLYLHGIFD